MRKRMLIAVMLTNFQFLMCLQAQEASERPPSVPIEIIDAPALVALVRGVVTQHPEVRAAQAALESRNALQQAAERPLFNPELLVDVQNTNTNDRTIGISQTLDLSGRRRARNTVAQYERDLAVAELIATRRSIAGEVLSALADYWTAVGLNRLADGRIELMRAFAALALQRQQAGDLTQVDLNIATLAYSQAEIEKASGAAILAAADQSLRALVPRHGAFGWPALPLDLPVIRSDQLDVEQLLAQLPEIRVQQARAAAAGAAIELRDSERQANPTLSLVGGEEDGESLVGLSFTMPLNIRNRYHFEVAAAQAQFDLAQREAENIAMRARGRLLAASERYRLIRDAWGAWLRTGEPNLEQQGELLERLLQAGELSTTDYLVQLNQSLDTGASALELQRQLWLAWLEWVAATGHIDAWLGFSTEGAL